MNYIGNVKAQISYLKRMQVYFEKRLKGLPKGELKRKTSQSGIYYYEELDGQRISLRSRPQRLAQLREKRRITDELEKLKENLPLLEWMMAAYQPLLPLTGAMNDSEWGKLQEQQNSFSTVDRQITYNGVYYKSKSEVLIAMLLTSWGLEFKYETKVKLVRRTVYPDFTVRRPRDGKIFYWEHAGKVKDDGYVLDLHRKLDDYQEAGIRLWDNLILTFDREDGGIDMDTAERIVKLYLLEA